MLVPQWDVRVLSPVVATDNAALTVSADRPAPDISPSTPPLRSDSRVTDAVAPASRLWSQRVTIPVVWAVGFLGVLAWLTAGRIRLRRIAAGSWPLAGSDWDRALEEEKREAGVLRHVRLLSSSVVSTPLTWGSRAPVILLPEDALDWPEVHRRIVLRHGRPRGARRCALAARHRICRACIGVTLSSGSPSVGRGAEASERGRRVVSLGTPVAVRPRTFGSRSLRALLERRFSSRDGAALPARGRLLAVLRESRRRVHLPGVRERRLCWLPYSFS